MKGQLNVARLLLSVVARKSLPLPYIKMGTCCVGGQTAGWTHQPTSMMITTIDESTLILSSTNATALMLNSDAIRQLETVSVGAFPQLKTVFGLGELMLEQAAIS